ncbi:GNAT family N-acetyltransferase [Urbifossiella limnaea]|uniref:GNAT family N-acetyltransferase n=1 Tax=Urbifossiella limnaea TaxID=2528023 RepID=A0A517Y379_9BACT|nr:hypothetical protein [Urbifossiella limnaea]QDU24191.1 hypothetical protein ETAA1_62050 [Urbifossiella limnaea]
MATQDAAGRTATGIREFRDEDVPAVAALWLRAYHKAEVSPPALLQDYFRDAFLRDPLNLPDLPSLVCTNGGKVIGFLGVLSRRATFRGRPKRYAVPTQLMVDPTTECGFAAIDLLKRFLAGPQDFSYADGAQDNAARLWQILGGDVVPLLCLDWMRVFRPLRHRLTATGKRVRFRSLLQVAQPLGWVVDAVAGRLPFGPYRVRQPAGSATEADATTVLACWDSLPRKSALRPAYDADSLSRLLGAAAASTGLGRFRTAVVRDRDRRSVGWFAYYLNPGGLSRVVQVGAAGPTAGLVFDHLMFDAWAQGSAALEGMADPRHLRELDDRHARYRCCGLGVAVHSRDPDLLYAIHRGNSSLSRLDAEWCLPFVTFTLAKLDSCQHDGDRTAHP